MTTRPKILFVSHDATRTGAPLFLLNQLRWFRAHTDLPFAIILRAGGPLEADFRALGETLVNPDGASLREFLGDIKLIYANTCTNGHFLDTLASGTIPILTHVHEMESVIANYGEYNWTKVLEQTDQFVACSQSVSAALQKRGVPEEKIRIIYSAIPVAHVLENAAAIAPEELRRQQGWQDDFIVMGCGVTSHVKGPDFFLEVAGHWKRRSPGGPRVRFVWVGRILETFAEKISPEALAAAGLQDSVEFLGERSNPYPYLQAADIFCLCSREDPFPLVMLEAALLGKPILHFEQSGGADEFCRQGTGVGVPPARTDLMAEKIQQLAGPETERRLQMGRTGRTLVPAEYDIAAIARQMLAQIDAVTNPQAVPAYRLVCVQFPVPAQPADYYEPASEPVIPWHWTRLRFPIPPRMSATLPIRVEPADNPATVLIAGLTVRSRTSGETLWRANAKQLKFNRWLIGSKGARYLRIFTPGTKGFFFLPALPATSEPLEVQCWVHLSPLPRPVAWYHRFRTWRKKLTASNKAGMGG